MAASFEGVLQEIGDLRAQAMQRLQWIVTHERPRNAGHVLASRFEDWLTEFLAMIGEAEAAGLQGEAAAEFGAALDLPRCGAALTDLHRVVRQMARLYADQLASPGTFAALQALGTAAETRAWMPWARGVSEALVQCRRPLGAVEDRVAELWAGWAEVACAGLGAGLGAALPARLGRHPRSAKVSRSAHGGQKHAAG
jgi:hypothetical protein